MLNSIPKNKNYHNGNFIPKNKDKVLKLNSQGGIYYRSSWEFKIMTWLDNNKMITKWGAECMRIPYQMTHFDNGDVKVKNHNYYPDFYYEMKLNDGMTKKVIAEDLSNLYMRAHIGGHFQVGNQMFKVNP